MRQGVQSISDPTIFQSAAAHGWLAQHLSWGAPDAIRILFGGAVNRVEGCVIRELKHLLEPIALGRCGGSQRGFLLQLRAQLLNHDICW